MASTAKELWSGTKYELWIWIIGGGIFGLAQSWGSAPGTVDKLKSFGLGALGGAAFGSFMLTPKKKD